VNGPGAVEWKGKLYEPGETIPGLPEEEAERLFGKGKVRPASDDKADEEAKAKAKAEAIGKMKVDELKDELKKRNIEIPEGAGKPDLVELLAAARKKDGESGESE
jgi:hypothetical protein